MKTTKFFGLTLAAMFAFSPALPAADEKTTGEKAAEVWDKTKEVTKEATETVVEKTRQAVAAVEDAIDKPDADARKVNVSIEDDGIKMPATLGSGKTAFVVKNTGKEKHNFEITGKNLEKSFWLAIAPGDSKTMQVELKDGSYEAKCSLHEKEPDFKLTVK